MAEHIIKFWGVRGSFPTPDRDKVEVGGHTSCVEVRTADNDLIVLDMGTGFVPLGIKGEWDKVSFSFDYRKNSENFLFNYWDQNYDNNRVTIESDNSLSTKESKLYKYGASEGLNFNLTSSLFKVLNFSIAYQKLECDKWNNVISLFEKDKNNTFYAKLDVDTSMITKVRIAEVFYQKSNSDDVFKFSKPDENTLYGYNIGLQMADNMVLLLKGRTSFIFDEQTQDYEPVKTTQMESQIIF